MMKKEDYLSIAEFAKRAGVTRQAVYKKLSTELTEYVKEVDGRKVINIKALELYGIEPVDTDLSTTFTDLAAHLQKQHDTLSHLVDILEAELAAKDQQLATKDLQIAEKDRQINQEQELHLITQQTHAAALLKDPAPQEPAAPAAPDPEELQREYLRGKADNAREIKAAFVALDERYPEAARYFLQRLRSEREV